ncbi:MAG: zinc-binding dehydrogenase, partial [Opitutaceae bacterium]|nr:zinc-binding dehydrogenase [Opitutaceae bacterium]
PGTELSFFEGTHISLPDPGNPWAKYPFRSGYATIGEVVEVGPDAPADAPHVGARIFFFGYHATWNLLSPEKVWLETPADLSDDAILLARLVQIAATGVEVLRRPPQRALVVGAGLIGLFAAQTLQARGCPFVVVQDVVPARLELARRNGLAHTALAEGAGLASARKLFGDESPDCVIEATGLASMVAPCLETVATNGDVSLLGIPRGESTLNLYRLVVRKNAALLGAHEGVIPDRAPPGQSSRQALIHEALAGMVAGRIRTEGLVSGHVLPQDCQTFYENLSRDKARWITAVIDWS